MEKTQWKVVISVDKLLETIQHHANLYYNLDNPEISDAEYDALVRRYRSSHPDAALPIGQPSSLFTKVQHDSPMLSLDNRSEEHTSELQSR